MRPRWSGRASPSAPRRAGRWQIRNGVKMGRKRSWDAGLANTVREMRDQGMGYGTIGTKLGIHASKVRRILDAGQ